ncbi:chorismate-binding protein [Candidatus Vidania fulgoroideorum]
MRVISKKNGEIIKIKCLNIYNIYSSLKKKLNSNIYISFLIKTKSKVMVNLKLEIVSFSKKLNKGKKTLTIYDYLYYEETKDINKKGRKKDIGGLITIFNNKEKTYIIIKEKKNYKRKIITLKILYGIIIKRNYKKENFFYMVKENKNIRNYICRFKKVKKYIKKGEIIQCQVGKENLVKENIKLIRLFKIYSGSDTYTSICISLLRESIICFTPEILVVRKKNNIYTYPIAGTIKRGINILTDKIYEKKLINDKKELSEHIMLIDIARNDLNSISKQNTVIVNKKFIIGKFYHVQHIISEVKSKVEREKQKYILKRISPPGTLTGSPKIKSMEIIKKLETNRGYYGGCIGFKNIKKGIGIFFVTIRAVFKKGNYLMLKSASGIVNRSKIKMEYRELNNKMKTFLKK